MVSFLEGVRRANRALNCFWLGVGGNIIGGLANISGIDPESAVNTSKALRRLAGCDPAEDPGLPPPDFTGGQCDFQYRVFFSGTSSTGTTAQGECVGTQSFSSTAVVWGPLSNFRLGGVVGCIGGPGPARQVLVTCHGPTNFPRSPTPVNFAIITRAYTFQVDSIVPQFGGPDACGDPPVVIPPPVNINVDVDVTYNIDDGTEVTVTIPFIYAPITVDINGNFRIPFTFEFGGIEFSGDVNVAPEFNVTINPPPTPRGTDSPFTDLPPPDDEIPVDRAPPRQLVIGVVVQAELEGEQQLTTIATTGIPQILAPRCGSVKFGYKIGDRSFWSPDIDVKDLNCFIPCPFSQGADTVAASPAPGVVLNYSPIFGPRLATVADLRGTPEP